MSLNILVRKVAEKGTKRYSSNGRPGGANIVWEYTIDKLHIQYRCFYSGTQVWHIHDGKFLWYLAEKERNKEFVEHFVDPKLERETIKYLFRLAHS